MYNFGVFSNNNELLASENNQLQTKVTILNKLKDFVSSCSIISMVAKEELLELLSETIKNPLNPLSKEEPVVCYAFCNIIDLTKQEICKNLASSLEGAYDKVVDQLESMVSVLVQVLQLSKNLQDCFLKSLASYVVVLISELSDLHSFIPMNESHDSQIVCSVMESIRVARDVLYKSQYGETKNNADFVLTAAPTNCISN